MIIHKVRQPFLCREGQFIPGKRSLCIGLDLHAIRATDKFRCFLGKNEKTYYEIDCAEALRVGQEWKNKDGKPVIIVPLWVAKRVVPAPAPKPTDPVQMQIL